MATERRLREEEDPDSNLFEGWKWSDWYPVMAPGRLRYKLKDWHDRAARSPDIRIRQGTLNEIFSNECYDHTVYEIMMVRGTLKVPVYVGETGKQTAIRLGQYCSNGSHIPKFTNNALQNDYQLFVRAKSNEEYDVGDDNKKYWYCRKPKLVETDALGNFDFAWNSTNNGLKRSVITRNVSGNASLRIHREMVDDSSVGDGWQWSNWKWLMGPGRAPKDDAFIANRINGDHVSRGIAVKRSSHLRRFYPNHFFNSFGIFELMLKKDDKNTVVYVGSSGETTLLNQLFVYCKGESEIEGLLTDAILSRYRVFARMKKSESLRRNPVHDKEVAKQDRDLLLDQYDYACNVNRNAVRNISK